MGKNKFTEIASFEELNNFVLKFIDNKSFMFRGQSNEEWELMPKAGRYPFNTLSDKISFDAWKRRAIEHLQNPPTSDWDWMAIAQHHGLATRLLDWTKNPLIAAFFSVNDHSDSHDGKLFCFKPATVVLDDKVEPFEYKKVSAFRPRGVVPRIARQNGAFTIHGDPAIPLDKSLREKDELEIALIKSTAKNDILWHLDYYGVNISTIFPDLDGLGKYINWRIDVTKGQRELEDE